MARMKNAPLSGASCLLPLCSGMSGSAPCSPSDLYCHIVTATVTQICRRRSQSVRANKQAAISIPYPDRYVK